MIESQKFVMTNLRNGIEYLKTTCKSSDKEDILMTGCTWAEWGPWTVCSKTCGGGTRLRKREKLPGIGT